MGTAGRNSRSSLRRNVTPLELPKKLRTTMFIGTHM
jgi:hypothetical protein